jgi:hypothetical protein
MGWCSGTEIFDAVVEDLLNPDLSKEDIIYNLILTLEGRDWDCQMESEYYDHPIVKKLFEEAHPDWFEEEDES